MPLPSHLTTDPHATSKLSDCKVVEVPEFPDESGNLTVVENGKSAPFDFCRVFYLHGMPEWSVRGSHSKFECHQLIIAINGSCDIDVTDGAGTVTYHLDRSNMGLVVPPGIWCDLKKFSPGVVVLVLADTPYSEEDYVRSREEFDALTAHKRTK